MPLLHVSRRWKGLNENLLVLRGNEACAKCYPSLLNSFNGNGNCPFYISAVKEKCVLYHHQLDAISRSNGKSIGGGRGGGI